jgi:hypothetical protein
MRVSTPRTPRNAHWRFAINREQRTELERLTGTESERIWIDIDLYVPEPSGVEAIRKALWIHKNNRVEQMNQSKEAAVDAVCTCEDSARSQNSVDVRQQPILQLRRRDVVKHGEANRSINALSLKRHRRGIPAKDVYIPAPHTTAEEVRKFAVDFNTRELLHAVLQDFGCGSVSGTDLENIGADVQAVNRPR